MNNGHYDSYGNHKDRNPEDTVARIKKILISNGINTKVSNWKKFSNNCYSVRVVDSELESVGTNGKGVSKNYALASAYSEYLERVQNGVLYLRRFGRKPRPVLKYHDEIKCGIQEINHKTNKYFNHVLNRLNLNNIKKKVTCIPYYNLKTKTTDYLPEFLVRTITGTNGMCAGNSGEEAILQGLCEILERYSLKTMFDGKLAKLSTISPNDYSKMKIYDLIQKYESYGFNIIVKDMTLGGKIPVIGVLLLDKKNDKCKYSCGSDVIFEVALQRCLTEITQGYSKQDLMKSLKKINSDQIKDRFKNYLYQVTRGQGEIPIDYKFKSRSTVYKKAFLDKYISNKHSLKWLINKLDNNWDVFIRDVSFLGHPSYHIFIPKVSDLYNIYGAQKYVNTKIKINGLIRNSLNIKSLNKEELIDLEKALIAIMKNPFIYSERSNTVIKAFKLIYLDKKANYAMLEIPLMIMLVQIMLNDYSAASRTLNKLINTDSKYKQSDYYKCLLYYLKMKSSNFKFIQIKKKINRKYPGIGNRVINQYKNKDGYTFKKALLNCADCRKCNSRVECHYRTWKDRVHLIKSKMKQSEINQNAISALVN